MRSNPTTSRALAELGKGPAFKVAAEAHLALADLAERRGDLALALAECEAGCAVRRRF